MGFYKQRELYNQAFAEANPDILHNQPVSDDDPTLRQSFFRINDETELIAACKNWVHFVAFVMVGLVGGFVNKNESIRQANINTFMFLDKITLDPDNPIDAPAISNAYDKTFDVMQAYIKYVYDDYEENPGCGPFKDIDLGKFKWEQVGPYNDQLYGWILTFSDETKPTL